MTHKRAGNSARHVRKVIVEFEDGEQFTRRGRIFYRATDNQAGEPDGAKSPAWIDHMVWWKSDP